MGVRFHSLSNTKKGYEIPLGSMGSTALGMACAHITVDANHNIDESKGWNTMQGVTIKGHVKCIAINRAETGSYAVFAVCLSTMNTQTGYGIFKINIKNSTPTPTPTPKKTPTPTPTPSATPTPPTYEFWSIQANIKKVDENGKALAGAKFRLYPTQADAEEETNALSDTLITGSNGYTSTWIKKEILNKTTSYTVYCKEIEAPDGYECSDEIYKLTWTLSEFNKLYNADNNTNGQLQTFGGTAGIVNESVWQVAVNAYKVDNNGKGLAGVTFGIFSDEACTPENMIVQLETVTNGYTGNYIVEETGSTSSVTLYCKELKAPDGYIIDKKIRSITCDKSENGTTKTFGGQEGIVNNPIELPKIKITKATTAADDIMELSGYSLEGAEFTITDGKGYTQTVTTKADGTTDELTLPRTAYYEYLTDDEGILTGKDPILHDDPVTYTITETKAPAGHTADPTPQTITVTCTGDTKLYSLTFTDEPEFATFDKIVKKSTKGNVIENVVYKLEFYDGTDTAKSPVRTWYMSTDKNGVITLDDDHISKDSKYKSDALYKHKGKAVLPISGKLVVTEVQAPAQYTMDTAAKEFTTTKDTTVAVNAANDVTPVKIHLKKYDADGKTPLSGVSFLLEFLEESEPSTDVSNYKRLLKVGESIEKTTDANGEVTFDNLDQGKYRITETKTTDGHTLLKDTIELTLPITMTTDDAKANNADTSKAKLDSGYGYTGKYFFFEGTYEITNTATFVIPMTGGNGFWIFGLTGFGIMAVTGTLITIFKKPKNKRRHDKS